MPVMSFEKTPAAKGTEPSTAVAVVANTPMPVGPANPVGPEGDWDNVSEAAIELRLGQKPSKFVEDNPELMGKWVYDKAIRLGPPEDVKAYSPGLTREVKSDSVLAIITRNQLYFEEDVEFGEGIIPGRWRTNAEARAAGVQYREAAVVDMLIPFTGEHEQLVIVGGLGFVKARFYAKKAAFRNVSQIVKRDEKTWLHGDKVGGFYELTVTKMTGAKGAYWVAGAKSAGSVPAELREAIREKYGI